MKTSIFHCCHIKTMDFQNIFFSHATLLTVSALPPLVHPSPELLHNEESSRDSGTTFPPLPKALLLFQPSPGVPVQKAPKSEVKDWKDETTWHPCTPHTISESKTKMVTAVSEKKNFFHGLKKLSRINLLLLKRSLELTMISMIKYKMWFVFFSLLYL